MASGIRETTKPQLEIYLERPWGGIASDADPVDIGDGQFVSGQGVVDVDGRLCQISIGTDPTIFKFVPAQTNAALVIIFNLAGGLFGIDQFGNVYQSNGGLGVFNFISLGVPPSDAPWPDTIIKNTTMAVQVLNGLAYIGVPTRHSIYTFAGTGGLMLASNFTGGRIIGVLDDYLLQMNTNSAVDGEKPTRVNWSSPGAFSVWDPAINRSAGFNTLINVESAITGFISLATVGVIIGRKELVEASPTGVGIKPFAFNTLWTSEVGKGILYPDSVAQYGKDTYAGTDTGIYKISTGGMVQVDAAVSSGILGPTQQSSLTFSSSSANVGPLFAGNVLLYAFNSTYPTPHYVFATTTPITGAFQNSTLTLWFLNLETGSWFNQMYDLNHLINSQNGTAFTNLDPELLRIASVTTAGFNSTANGFNQTPNLLVYGVATDSGTLTNHTFVAPIYIYNKFNVVTAFNVPGPLLIQSKRWEMKLGRKPTIRRVLIKAYGSGTLFLDFDGIPFGQIVLDGTQTTRVYKSPSGVITEEAPMLTIQSANFKGVITKVMMAGSYADGDID